MSLAAAVGLSVFLFVGALLAWHLGKFRIQQSFEPPSPVMQPLLDRYQRAYTEFQEGQIDRALAEFRLLVASGENLKGVGYDGLAAAYFEAELTDKALELLDEALGRFSQHAMAHLLRGDILYTKGQTEDALLAYQKAIAGVAAFPWQRAAAQTALGVFYGLQGAWDRARAAFTEAIAVDSSFYEAYVNLGYLARQEGRDEEAQRWFTKAHSLRPTDEVARYYRHLGQFPATEQTKPEKTGGGHLIIFPWACTGGNLRRLGTGEMLAGLLSHALSRDVRVTVLSGEALEAALQGRSTCLAGLPDITAAFNVAKLLGADFILYGSHRHYENILTFDARVVSANSMEVLATEYLKTQGQDKFHTAAQALAARLKPILAAALGNASR
jgi:tetratricopeptide (TPR) repeat protein